MYDAYNQFLELFKGNYELIAIIFIASITFNYAILFVNTILYKIKIWQIDVHGFYLFVIMVCVVVQTFK